MTGGCLPNRVASRAAPAFAALVLLAGCSNAPAPAPTPAPETGKRLVAERAMVASAHPLASEAGITMLRNGGNAVDAAIATAFTVSVGEPMMSGLGGGGGMLIWLQDEQRAEYIDFYSSAHAPSFSGVAADTAAHLREVAIPGEVAGLLAAHERFGRLSRAEVMAPAIRLAEQGFPVNQILAQMIAVDSAKLSRYPASAEVFLPEGRPLAPGVTLRQPELAASLRRIAGEGADGFYRGQTAASVVRAINVGGNPTKAEALAAYQPHWKRPLCAEYRGWTVLSAPPPQTGTQIIQTLQLLEGFDLAALGLPTQSARSFDVLATALRIGIADNRLNDDPRWEAVPALGMISEGYAATRRAGIGQGKALPEFEAGDPRPFDVAEPAPACSRLDPYSEVAAPPAQVTTAPGGSAADQDAGETTHLSVVDPEGNAVALTHTNSSLWGTGARVEGFFLNNSAFTFDGPGQSAGSSEWRTRKSTIAPTILLRDGRVEMVVGAPGGGRIPTAMVQTMIYTLDYGLDPLEAVRMPRIFPAPGNTRVQLENGFSADVLAQVRDLGYQPAALSFGYARIYMIARRDGRWIGVADPRHDGGVRGY